MVLDTSAVIAILFREPDTAPLVEAINQAPNLRMSAASVLEASLVIDSRLGTAAADTCTDQAKLWARELFL
ncbi:MAG TPA: type II toxin-antitoxin system VapC family toxin [Bryobacteraceae bacterium]|nr:type II toxin-antitoxin system VapC family toxin [Bryobacteraceae bacterium]